MKRILFLFYSLLIPVFIFAQSNAVFLWGEKRPIVNQMYNYQITSPAHGRPGTKATWTIENGKIDTPNGYVTSLQQYVDNRSVNVKWDKPNTTGILRYYYKDGSGTPYEGTFMVSIEPGSTGGGSTGGGSTGGIGDNDQPGQDTIVNGIKIIGPSVLTYNTKATFRLSKDVGNVQWTVQGKFIATTGQTKVKELHTQAKNLLKTDVFIRAVVPGGTVYKYVNILPPIVLQSDKVVCPGEKVVFKISDLPQDALIRWKGVNNMMFESNNGPFTGVFKSFGNGYGKVRAEVVYKGKSYFIENSEVWVGRPDSPSGISGFRNGQDFDLNSRYSLSAYDVSGATEYIWETRGGGRITNSNINGNKNVMLQTSGISVGWNQTKSFSLGLSAKNKCGVCGPMWLTGYVTFEGPGGIGMQERSLRLSDNTILIYNLSGILVYSDNNASSDFDIRNTVLTDGIYIIEKVDNEGRRTTEKVSLKR